MKLRLWSIQEEYKLDEIKSNGKLICIKNKYSKEWDNEYLWMKNKMEQRIGNSEFKNQYPIWAWYQHQDANRRKPDLRRTGHLPAGTNGVRIEFEKNKNEVLISDFVLWHFPLCYKSIIAKNEKEAKKFEFKLKKLKLDDKAFEDMPKEIQNEIESSWNKIFDMELDEKYFTQGRDEKMIQACCWEIKNEEIIKIDKFIAR